MTSTAMLKRKCMFTDELKTYIYVFASAVMLRKLMKTQVHSAKHKTSTRGDNLSSTVTNFFVSKTGPSVFTIAEGTPAFHTVNHHNSYRSMDCTSGLLRKIFPDLVTAQTISSAWTKTESIVNAVIATHSVDVAMEALEEILYPGVSTDGSLETIPSTHSIFWLAKWGSTKQIS
ncbi:unnamed protein product [Lepeophtheirus salmonis]|uniref:(salmon louse) hypothetical protein n=1 Tax=Lepeophtheirus salmonis TaxID=72036 RepID=A0A7R8D062_LEPSM|nr:unnamed protein product [Lepeophtheirus salmonis]CAF2980277.1 unnamed protein product [Lepeophtheirus salmonis]